MPPVNPNQNSRPRLGGINLPGLARRLFDPPVPGVERNEADVIRARATQRRDEQRDEYRAHGTPEENGVNPRTGGDGTGPQPPAADPNRIETQVDHQQVALTLSMTNEALGATLWTNSRSGKIMKVMRISGDEVERKVQFVMVGGLKPFTLALVTFATKYHPSTHDELVAALLVAGRSGPQAEGGTDETREVGILVEPEERHTFEHMILHGSTTEALKVGLNRIVKRTELEEVWGMSLIESRANRCAMGFYGDPGTGKTLAALCIAKQLNKKLYQVDYSQVISKWVGNTAKHIKMAFDRAREEEAILFWDEADSLVSKRVSGGTDQSFATSINQNRNVLMQELDRFDGIVIFTTNLFENYDPAILRRIAQHVPFRLPDKEMRVSLFHRHLPRMERVDVPDWNQISEAADGFSGGDILNVVINAINRASLAEDSASWRLTPTELLKEIALVREAKLSHGKKKSKNAATLPASFRPPTPPPTLANQAVVIDASE